jgi:hypothetical protein
VIEFVLAVVVKLMLFVAPASAPDHYPRPVAGFVRHAAAVELTAFVAPDFDSRRSW